MLEDKNSLDGAHLFPGIFVPIKPVVSLDLTKDQTSALSAHGKMKLLKMQKKNQKVSIKSGPGHAKTCLMLSANNKGADQPVLYPQVSRL